MLCEGLARSVTIADVAIAIYAILFALGLAVAVVGILAVLFGRDRERR